MVMLERKLTSITLNNQERLQYTCSNREVLIEKTIFTKSIHLCFSTINCQTTKIYFMKWFVYEHGSFLQKPLESQHNQRLLDLAALNRITNFWSIISMDLNLKHTYLNITMKYFLEMNMLMFLRAWSRFDFEQVAKYLKTSDIYRFRTFWHTVMNTQHIFEYYTENGQDTELKEQMYYDKEFATISFTETSLSGLPRVELNTSPSWKAYSRNMFKKSASSIDPESEFR